MNLPRLPFSKTGYRLFDGIGGVEAWVSESLREDAWDDFLLSQRSGQFQQSARWGASKTAAGWSPSRCLLVRDRIILGGFQLLSRRKAGLLRIGYVSKGPVLVEGEHLEDAAVEALRRFVHFQKVDAVICQPPDHDAKLVPSLKAKGFLPNRFMNVIDANLEIDLTRSFEQILADMRRDTRKKLRQAARRGCAVKEGQKTDLKDFFELMLLTCRRQETSPNPAKLGELETIWAVFNEAGERIRLTFAVLEGRPIAGLVCLLWGRRMTLWKKGWSLEETRRRPNHLLYWEALNWAKENGFEVCDFLGLRRSIARCILDNRSLPESARRSRDFFNLGFGGVPILLPPALVAFRSRFAASCYRYFHGLTSTY